MKWTRGTENDDVVDVRGQPSGGGGGRGLRLGGGSVVVVILVAVVAQVLGVDVSGMFSGGSSSTTSGSTTSSTSTTSSSSSSTTTTSRSSTTTSSSHTPKPNDPDAELVDYIKFTMKDIQDTFTTKFHDEGKTYQRAKLLIFTNSIATACGQSSSEIGPFYCPGDSQAYIDLSFYRALRERFGAPGDFAQAYVLAHEIGHHIQNLLGIEGKAERLARHSRKRNAVSVRQELQADCYAGVWGSSAQQRKLLEAGDIEEALTAATAIGDDRLQKQAGIDVDAETWTHGSSAQRVKWFKRGFESGRLDACDTFSVETP